MTLSPANLAAASETLVGVPFRLGGRDPAKGVDCVGVLAAALARCGITTPVASGYTLRMTSLDGWLPPPADLGFAPVDDAAVPGDVVLLQSGPAQFHIAIAATGGWVHAHAGLRRVVLGPALPDGPIIHHWRVAHQG